MLVLFVVLLSLGGQGAKPLPKQGAVKLLRRNGYVVMDNGMVRVTMSNPTGFVTGVLYNGVDNLLEGNNKEDDRGYWDLVWSEPGTKRTRGTSDRISDAVFKVVVETEEQVELSFKQTWNSSVSGKQVPLNIDKRFVLLRNSSGFYSYAIYERFPGWPAFNLPRTRLGFKLRKDKFNYMAISDDRQRFMPLPDDRFPNRSQPLEYPEAVRLVNPVEPQFRNEVDDKYQYSCILKHLRVHGWISLNPNVGFWIITPSDEFRPAWPLKQDLSSHVGPTSLAIFHSPHYGGEDIVLKFGPNEAWRKVFGPVYIYLNSGSSANPHSAMWEDAKKQSVDEAAKWPYNFPASPDFPKADKRGSVSGRLLVRDRYISHEDMVMNGSYVGLASPGNAGSWQTEYKGYQFWTTIDDSGYFSINHARAGDYNLFAWFPGFIGDYRHNSTISIIPGKNIDLGDLTYEPPRYGPTLWEIGFPDRSAKEFFIPDPNPDYVNRLYVNHTDRYRQYGLWERYAELYPFGDLNYTINDSHYHKDWFFAQVTRKVGNGTYQGTTWRINFMLKNVDLTAIYKLRIALASAHDADLQVRVSCPREDLIVFSSGQIGKDNAIARHGINGLYYIFSIDILSKCLVVGNNTILLTQPLSNSPFQGFMYDYIRMEVPPTHS